MGKYNDLLVEFMKKKNDLVKRHTGLILTKATDINELKSWPNSRCRSAMSMMRYNNLNIDSNLCPWCRIELDCNHCGYGKRNGICLAEGSRYRKILIRLWDSKIPYIGKIPGMIIEYEKMRLGLMNDISLYM